MNDELHVRASAAGTIIPVRVHPGARRTGITGLHDGALKISLQPPPAEGRANEALVDFLAGYFRVPRSSVTITSGQSSRNKTVLIRALAPRDVLTVLSSRDVVQVAGLSSPPSTSGV